MKGKKKVKRRDLISHLKGWPSACYEVLYGAAVAGWSRGSRENLLKKKMKARLRERRRIAGSAVLVDGAKEPARRGAKKKEALGGGRGAKKKDALQGGRGAKKKEAERCESCCSGSVFVTLVFRPLGPAAHFI
ncbi:hypothetical protein L484_012797 [Morus notabilis]|uniref:Uncharacterized protein n=1 Tax=Morus notabilis TaxID=981085 RepID=W9SB44_9ROSA|nr:hypothetical protein L484_012797 [Morus notabilis]